MEEPIPKKTAVTEDVTGSRKRKANKEAKAEKGSPGIRMQYCQLRGTNPMHGMVDCFELNLRKKQAKEFEVIQRHEKQEKTRIPYKELNAFILTPKLNTRSRKRPRHRKQKNRKWECR